MTEDSWVRCAVDDCEAKLLASNARDRVPLCSYHRTRRVPRETEEPRVPAPYRGRKRHKPVWQ